jgi:hypothetical protein
VALRAVEIAGPWKVLALVRLGPSPYATMNYVFVSVDMTGVHLMLHNRAGNSSTQDTYQQCCVPNAVADSLVALVFTTIPASLAPASAQTAQSYSHSLASSFDLRMCDHTCVSLRLAPNQYRYKQTHLSAMCMSLLHCCCCSGGLPHYQVPPIHHRVNHLYLPPQSPVGVPWPLHADPGTAVQWPTHSPKGHPCGSLPLREYTDLFGALPWPAIQAKSVVSSQSDCLLYTA